MTDSAPRRHNRTGLFAPFILLAIALAGWTGWWFYLANQIETRLAAQAQTLRQDGWTVGYQDQTITGWPFRTKLNISDVTLKAPSGLAVSSPTLVAEANAHNPTKWVIVAKDGLSLNRPGKGQVDIGGEGLRASVHGLNQRWPNLAVEFIAPTFATPQGAEPFPVSRAGLAQFYLRPHLAPAGTPGVETSVDVLFRLIDAEGRPGGPVEGMAQNGKLTLQLEAVITDADKLSGADAAGVFSTWTKAGGRFTRVRGEIKAGDSRATLSSDLLAAGTDGRLEGQVNLTADRPMPALSGLADASGQPTPATPAPTNPGAENAHLTLVFKNGRAFLGPFALAPSPKLF